MSNPAIRGFYADPDIACFNGRFYIYPTTDGGVEWNSSFFKVFSSENLIDWQDEGEILNLKDVPWSEGKCAWAPAIGEKNGKYYFYYSANKNIGVAVADSPTGPFTDKGDPLIAADMLNGQMIDPDVFIDDDGQAYLYWGNTSMYAAKLSDNMTELLSIPINITPDNFCEASCVFRRNGIYYFTWSDNDTRSPEYNVHYGIGRFPLQRPEGDTVILSRHNTEDPRIKCTGHHSILNIPGTDEWYICYHRFGIDKYGDVEGYSQEAGNHREICIDKLEFSPDGRIIPVRATLSGVTKPVTAYGGDKENE